MASLSSWPLVFALVATWLNLYGTTLFQQLINMAQLIEMWTFVRVSAYVCVAFNKVEVALQIYFHALLHVPFNNV